MEVASVRLPDPQNSRAVLVGCAIYDSLESLPAVTNNLDQFARLLADPDLWGLPPENCTTLADPRTVDVVLDAVHEAAVAATDTLIVYFAGHGLLDPRNSDLYLALPQSSLQRLHKAVRYDDIRREVIDTAGCPGKVVILDCCYSGQAMIGGMGVATEMADQARIEGSYLLTASAETKLALAPIGEEFTAFTGEVIAALRRGVVDGPELLDLDTLYWHVRRELEAKGRPIPQQRVRNDGHSLALVRNRRGRTEEQPTRPDNRLAAELTALLRQPPRQLAATVADFSASGRDDAVTFLLDTAAATRPEQEIAALIESLQPQSKPSHVRRVIGAAARRPPTEIIGLLRVLTETGRPDEITMLLDAVAGAPGAQIAAIAGRLDGTPHGSLLLDLAMRHRSADGGALELIKAMSSARLMAASKQIIDRAVAEPSSCASAITLSASLWSAKLHEEADHALRRIAPNLSDQQVIEAADLLRSADQPEQAYKLFVLAAAERPVDSVVSFAQALRDVGRPLDANGLLDETALRRPAVEVADLVLALDGMPEAARRVLDAAARPEASWPTSLAGLPAARAPLGRLQPLFGPLAGLSTEKVIELVTALIRAGAWTSAAMLLYEVRGHSPDTAATVASRVATSIAGDWRGPLLDPVPSTPDELDQLIFHLELPGDRPWQQAITYWRAGELDEAEQQLRQLIRHGAGEVRGAASITLAVLLRDEHHRYSDARRLLDRTIADNDHSTVALARIHRAVIHEVNGNGAKARADYEAALGASDPRCTALAGLHLGWLLADHDEIPGARDSFRQGLSCADGSNRDWLRLALGEVQRGADDNEAQELWEAVTGSPDALAAGHAALLLAELHRSRRDLRAADEQARAVLDNPGAAELWPILLDRETATTTERRIFVMSHWLAWLREGFGTSLQFGDRRRPAGFLQITSDEGLIVEAPLPPKARLAAGRRQAAVVDYLTGLGFVPSPDNADTVNDWMFWAADELDDETVAVTCESILTSGYGSRVDFHLFVTRQTDAPLDPLPRPPVPDLLP
jgi:tetratricopeptide (TPR) repeat protein